MFSILCSFNMESYDCFSKFNLLRKQQIEIISYTKENVLMDTTYIGNEIGYQNFKRLLLL